MSERTYPKCTLCPNKADNHFWLSVHDGFYALCDGHAPYDNKDDIERVSDQCRAVAKPLINVAPRFGFNDTRKPQ